MKKSLVVALICANCVSAMAANPLKQATPPQKVESPKPAVPPKTISAKNPPVVPVDPYSHVPFDLNSKSVPVPYKGNNIQDLYEKLTKKLAPKGEFETTSASEQRIANALQQPLDGLITPQSDLALFVDLDPEGEYADLKYDADSETLEVKAYMSEVSVMLGEYETTSKQRVINGGRGKSRVLRTYMAENAYGAKREVVVREDYSYDLIMTNPKDFEFKKDEFDYLGDRQNLNFDVRLSIESAQKSKKDLDLLVIFNLVPPYTASATEVSTAKVDIPVDLTSNIQYVYGSVKEIWLYNSRTGEIVTKLKSKA